MSKPGGILKTGKEIELEGVTYVEISFTEMIDRDVFKQLAKILYGEECVFSKEVRKWFAPKQYVETIARKVDIFMEDQKQAEESSIGKKLGELYENS